MKSLFKFLFFASVITAVIVVVTNNNRKRATAPAGGYPTPWSPPTVADEPPAAPAADVPDWESGAVPGQELEASDVAALMAEAEVAEHEQVVVPESPIETPSPEAPVSELPAWEAAADPDQLLEAPDVAALMADAEVERTSEPAAAVVEIVVEELPAEVENLLVPTPEEAEALAVGDDDGFAAPIDLDEESPWEEVAEPMHLEPETVPSMAEFIAPVEDASREAPVAETEESVDPVSASLEEEAKEPDFLTKYFEELAATPEEAPLAAVEAEAPVATTNSDSFLTSVEKALDDLEPAPIIPPPRRTAESYLDEGNVYFNVGQYSLAIERYGQAVGLDGNLTAAYYNRANAHTRAGDFEKALADYDRALELQPEDADALNNRGMLHLYRANYPGALKDFNQALQADPADTTVMVNRGLANLHSGNAAAALVDFREAGAMDNNDAAAQYGAAQASASLGNRDEALKHVARALELDPGYAREAAADQHLAVLQGDEQFLKLLRQSGSRPTA